MKATETVPSQKYRKQNNWLQKEKQFLMCYQPTQVFCREPCPKCPARRPKTLHEFPENVIKVDVTGKIKPDPTNHMYSYVRAYSEAAVSSHLCALVNNLIVCTYVNTIFHYLLSHQNFCAVLNAGMHLIC